MTVSIAEIARSAAARMSSRARYSVLRASSISWFAVARRRFSVQYSSRSASVESPIASAWVVLFWLSQRLGLDAVGAALVEVSTRDRLARGRLDGGEFDGEGLQSGRCAAVSLLGRAER